MVAFPGEFVHLHIFEPRYKQLIRDVQDTDRVFGIPVYVEKVKRFGTTVRITEISKTYSDGRLDIKTIGLRVFEIEELLNPMPGKLYPGAVVTYPPDSADGDNDLRQEIKQEMERLLKLLNISHKMKVAGDMSTYRIAHLMGMPLEDEYKMLKIGSERERQRFLLARVSQLENRVAQRRQMQKRIQGNGHFKHLDPLDF